MAHFDLRHQQIVESLLLSRTLQATRDRFLDNTSVVMRLKWRISSRKTGKMKTIRTKIKWATKPHIQRRDRWQSTSRHRGKKKTRPGLTALETDQGRLSQLKVFDFRPKSDGGRVGRPRGITRQPIPSLPQLRING